MNETPDRQAPGQRPQRPEPGQGIPEGSQQAQAQQPQQQTTPPYSAPAYGAPQYAPQYAPPAQAPRSPAQQPQQRRGGLPVGAWIGIIGGGVLVLLLLVLLAVFVIVPAVLHLGAPASAPPPATAPPESDAPEPDTDTVTLDDHLDYAAGPFWSVPFDDEWTIDTFDVDGYNRFSHPETGCKLLTFQGAGDPAETSDSDRVASENLLGVALKIGLPWEATADPEVVPEGSVELMFDYAQPVEMAHYRATYPAASGDRERRILIREFTPGNNALYAEVDCPSTEIDGVADGIFEQLGITQY